MKRVLLFIALVCAFNADALAQSCGPLLQSTTRTLVLGPFLDETDGDTPLTGLTISQADVRLSKAGGAFAQKNETTSCSHMENGYYGCPVNTTDTNTLRELVVQVNEATA